MSIYCSAIDNLPEEDYPFGTLLKFIYKQPMQPDCKQINEMICSSFLLNRQVASSSCRQLTSNSRKASQLLPFFSK